MERGDDPAVLLVDEADAEIFLSTHTAKEFVPEQVRAYEDRKRAAGTGQAPPFDITRFHRKILRWLVIDQQPFTEAESKPLRAAFEESNKEAVLKSRTTYHRMLVKVLEEEREKFKALLATHQGLFNFTTDAWSDIQQREFLGTYICEVECSGMKCSETKWLRQASPSTG
jgi:hypothetical protein